MKNRSLFSQSLRARIFCGVLIAVATVALTSCHSAQYYYYKFPQYTFANRPIPPSKLAQRVMVAYTPNGSSGALAILDAKRDIRNNVEDTIPSFSISGYSAGVPQQIISFPAEVSGFVYSPTNGHLALVNYSKESATTVSPAFPSYSSSVAVPTSFAHYYSAEAAPGILAIIDNTNGATYQLNIPNVDQVAVNTGDTVVLAMVHNSNTIYRLFKLNTDQFATADLATQATGATDCEPYNLPVYCVVPIPGNYDRPSAAYFSVDGNTVNILNCGAECGGTTASVSFLQQGALNVNLIPSVASPAPSPVLSNVLVPGGVTTALSDGTTLYVAGQQLQPDGLFTGFLSTINLAAAVSSPSTAVTGQYSISDGTHTKLLFADNNTLWIGSHGCATGERQKLNENYNCLTRFDRGALTAQIIPNVTPGGATTVPYPNANQDQYYYGDLTGLCWIQGFNKIYTAYGGQVHAFNTADGSEINNYYITVQGTALDVAYLDAVADTDN